MGWFYLDDPQGRDLVAHWKERPGMLGLRFYTNERHLESWFTDGTAGSRKNRDSRATVRPSGPGLPG
jgi:hypothetical protein